MTTPSRPPIVLQHEDVELRELSGARCEAFLALCLAGPSTVGVMYIRLDSQWHRFFLDAGLLFWKEGRGPDDGDGYGLENDEVPIDWGKQLHVIGVTVSEIMMTDSTLTMRFHNGAVVVLKHFPLDPRTSIVQFSGPTDE